MPLHEQTWGCITKTGSRMKRLEGRPKTMGIIGSDRSLSGYNILTPSNQNTLKYFPINETGMHGGYNMMGALARSFHLRWTFVAKKSNP